MVTSKLIFIILAITVLFVLADESKYIKMIIYLFTYKNYSLVHNTYKLVITLFYNYKLTLRNLF